MTQAQAIQERDAIRTDTPEKSPPVVTMRLKGRFMLPDRSEHACTATRLDIETVQLEAGILPEEGALLVLYLEDVGRLEGKVVHPDEDAPVDAQKAKAEEDKAGDHAEKDAEKDAEEGDEQNESDERKRFHLALKMTAKRREKMVQTLEWLKAKAEGRARERRRHLRIEPQDGQSRIVLSDGRSYPCEVLDISLSGASVRMAVLPAIGTHVTLGKMRGRVVRHHESGIAIEFVQTARPEALKQTVRKL